MEKGSLGKLLLGVAYLEGDFVLRSGRRSRYYLDKYLFETEPRVLRGVVNEMALMIRNRMAAGAVYHRLAAPELGAVSLGAGLSLESGIPFLIVRKGEKGYGTSKAIEGTFVSGERVAVVEDIVTSGGAALAAVDKLREAGLVVEDLYCVVDREEGGADAAAAAGLTLYSLFTSTELGIGGGAEDSAEAADETAPGSEV
ncbi:MAG: orotate phosphoribosyltransferase [Thermoleophilia bacterium]